MIKVGPCTPDRHNPRLLYRPKNLITGMVYLTECGKLVEVTSIAGSQVILHCRKTRGRAMLRPNDPRIAAMELKPDIPRIFARPGNLKDIKNGLTPT